MNCYIFITFSLVFLVLIDTWWNVNVLQYRFVQITLSVLIDTWWNVNENVNLAFMEIFARFNRYMVECEYLKKCFFVF